MGSAHAVSGGGVRLSCWRRGLLWIALALVGGPLWAHRPTESTAEFRWEHGRLEGRVTFPLEMASALLEDPEVTALGVENFSANRARLIERVSDALIVQVDGREVKPLQVSAELSREGEVACVFIFPSHALASLSVRAPFLEKVPVDCFCLLRVWEGADRLKGRRLLVRSAARATVLASDYVPGASTNPLSPEVHHPVSPARPPRA